jgi:hypothetical protein
VALQASDVETAIQNASAVHVKGTMAEGGSTIGLDVQINKAGTASGTISIGGPSYPIIYADKVVYIQFTPDVIKASGLDPASAAGKLLANKWVPSTSKVLAGSGLASSVQPLLDYTQFVGEIGKNMPSGPLKVGKSDTVDGVVDLAGYGGAWATRRYAPPWCFSPGSASTGVVVRWSDLRGRPGFGR